MRRLMVLVVIAGLVGVGLYWRHQHTPKQPDTAQGMEAFDGPESAKKLLEKNGFVAVPRFCHRIFSPYLHSRFPPFITADSVHNTFHVIFEDALKEFEAQRYGEMRAVIAALCTAAGEHTAGSPEVDVLVRNYLDVARRLLEESSEGEACEAVATDLAQIHAAQAIGLSKVLGYPIDYTQFKPRGFYTSSPELERYFRAMTWLGCAGFRLKSDTETLAAMHLAVLFRADKALRAAWQKMDAQYTRLLFQCDDLTIDEYAGVLDSAQSQPPSLDDFRGQVRKLRTPRYNDMVLPPELQENWPEETRGMRFMGRRYLPDGGVFAKVTDPAVPNRYFPSGLDVLAANGSAQARKHLEPELSKYPKYAAGLEQATRDFSGDKAAFAQSHYMKVVRVMESLTAAPHEKAAPFAKTSAYADKNMMTALGAWASMRHAWILHAKQGMAAACADSDEPLVGYIEPNPAFFDAMLELTADSIAVFGIPQTDEANDEPGSKSPASRFAQFAKMLTTLKTMLAKQLNEQRFSEEDKEFFTGYGRRLQWLQTGEKDAEGGDAYPSMGLAADVFSTTDGSCLQVATGNAMPIYALVPQHGRQTLVLGGMYSYYEFLQPSSERLTDAAWHERLAQRKAPPMPDWSASFVPNLFDADEILASLKKGEMPEEALAVDDPRLKEFLLNRLNSTDPPAKGTLDPDMAFAIFAQKYPEEARPFVLKRLHELKSPAYEILENFEQYAKNDHKEFERLSGKVSFTGALLSFCWEPSMVEELMALSRVDGNHADMAVKLSAGIKDKSIERFWRSLLRPNVHPSARSRCIGILTGMGSFDAIPELTDVVASGQPSEAKNALMAISRILYLPKPMLAERFKAEEKTELNGPERDILRDAAKRFLDEEMAREPYDSREYRRNAGPSPDSYIVQLALDLGVPDVLPRLIEGISKGVWEMRSIFGTVMGLDKTHAFDFGVALLPLRDDESTCSLAESFAWLGDKRALYYMRDFLNDTRPSDIGGFRVCDRVCLAMERLSGAKPSYRTLYNLTPQERQYILKEIDARCAKMLEQTKDLTKP